MEPPINFVLWVFEICGITDVKRQELANTLNFSFMAPLVGEAGGRIRTATARVVEQGDIITPGRFDAVVFLTTIGFQGAGSIMKRVGQTPQEAIGNENVKGLTVNTFEGGGIAEVYWNRCQYLSHVAGTIFHEACHLKFNETPWREMHTQRGEAGFGGEGVRVLASHTRAPSFPSPADLYVFGNAIPNVVPLRDRVPR